MDGRADREVLEEIEADVDQIKITLAEQAAILKEHIRRTAVAEARLDKHEEAFKPLQTHVAMWGYMGKVITAAGALTGVVMAVLKALGVL